MASSRVRFRRQPALCRFFVELAHRWGFQHLHEYTEDLERHNTNFAW
jgi:hypothetical protein